MNTLNVDSEKRPAGANPVRRTSLVTLILDQLRELIAAADLRPGDRLPPERLLAAQLAVSRPSLRAALDWLTERGALRRVQGGGTYLEANISSVLAQSRDNELVESARLADLLEARTRLEPMLAEMAARRATPEQIQSLKEEVLQAGTQLSDHLAWFQHDLHFHVRLGRMSGNSILAGTLESLFPQILMLWQAHRESIDVATLFEDHQSIVAAIERHDPVAASREMTRHLESFQRVIGNSLSKA